eukprot:2332330-Prorocentrum_lima.AAC.1
MFPSETGKDWLIPHLPDDQMPRLSEDTHGNSSGSGFTTCGRLPDVCMFAPHLLQTHYGTPN